jgi:hypothetical protein
VVVQPNLRYHLGLPAHIEYLIAGQLEQTITVAFFVQGPLGLLAHACQAKCCILRTKAWLRYYATRLGRTLVEPKSASLDTWMGLCRSEKLNIEYVRGVGWSFSRDSRKGGVFQILDNYAKGGCVCEHQRTSEQSTNVLMKSHAANAPTTDTRPMPCNSQTAMSKG